LRACLCETSLGFRNLVTHLRLQAFHNALVHAHLLLRLLA
jgi:hypothetical protein